MMGFYFTLASNVSKRIMFSHLQSFHSFSLLCLFYSEETPDKKPKVEEGSTEESKKKKKKQKQKDAEAPQEQQEVITEQQTISEGGDVEKPKKKKKKNKELSGEGECKEVSTNRNINHNMLQYVGYIIPASLTPINKVYIVLMLVGTTVTRRSRSFFNEEKEKTQTRHGER